MSINKGTAQESSRRGGHTNARAFLQLSPAGGDLRVVHLTAQRNGSHNPGAPLLEFVVHNGASQYDKAPEGKSPCFCRPFNVIKSEVHSCILILPFHACATLGLAPSLYRVSRGMVWPFAVQDEHKS